MNQAGAISSVGRRVVKVGGSLLTRGELPSQLDEWVQRQGADEHTIWLAGGGRLADVVRQWDERFSLQSAALRPTLRCLQASAELLAALRHAGPPLAPSAIRQRLATARRPAEVVLDPQPLVTALSTSVCRRLRIDTWEATSDTIAALAAHQLGCRQLVLLKACPIPSPPPSLDQLARLGIVDPVFGQAAAGIETVRVEPLRPTPPSNR